MALATCPPGRMEADSNSTLEPRAGYSWRGMSVSVALRPTPTTSTWGTVVIENELSARGAGRKKDERNNGKKYGGSPMCWKIGHTGNGGEIDEYCGRNSDEKPVEEAS